jgi:hypothetical protein
VKKALWDTSMDSGTVDVLLRHAVYVGAKMVCIRTTSAALPAAIPEFAAKGIAVYGWRWPAVDQQLYHAPHYYAMDEAKYVGGTLIPAGLAGYIVDPESDGPGVNDWNRHDTPAHIASTAALAKDFCNAIRSAAPPGFHFGLTSGCEYPTGMSYIPWGEFVSAADALYPQTYWRWLSKTGLPQDIHGGTPAAAYAKGLASWSKIAKGKPLIAIAGEIGVLDATRVANIAQYASVIATRQSEAHFYSDSANTHPSILAAISAI